MNLAQQGRRPENQRGSREHEGPPKSKCGVWIFSNAAVRRAYSSYVTGEVELVSAWAPLVWPFFTALALGLVVFWLQCFIEAARHMVGIFTGHPLMPPDTEV